MSININERKLGTALALAEDGKYFDAAAVFATIDEYEAKINHIGCLCAIGEMIAACEEINKLYERYGETHNCFADICKLGDVAEKVLHETKRRFRGERKIFASAPDRLSADPKLVGQYEFIPDDEDSLGLELDFYNDSSLWENAALAEGSFFDVKSKLYRDHLRLIAEKAFLDSDMDKFEKYAKRLIALTADDLDSIEAQLALCYYLGERKKALKFANKLAKFTEGVSARALRVAFEILFDDEITPQKKVVTSLMQLALPVLNELSPLDLCDLTMYAEREIGNNDLAYKFAEKLYPMCDVSYGAVDYLKVCACAFYNVKNSALAREAALKILSVLPDDCFAGSMARFVNEQFDDNYDAHMNIESFDNRIFWLPTPLVIYEHYTCFGIPNGQMPTFGKNQFEGMRSLISFVKYLYNIEVENSYLEFTSLVRYALSAVKADDQEYIDFAKSCLSGIDNDVYVDEGLLQGIILRGCRDKVLVCGKWNYTLDLSQITLNDDKLFLAALGTCAAISVVDVPTMEHAYNELKQKAGGVLPDASVVAVAYYMLASTEKGFNRSPEAKIFAPQEKVMFKEYLTK